MMSSEAVKSVQGIAEDKRPDVFRYLDYRKYLEAYYSYRKVLNPSYSYQVFSKKAGVCTSYLRMVISWKRNIPENKIRRIAQACDLNHWEMEYFVTLVQWNQAEDAAIKDSYWATLVKLAPKDNFHHIKGLEQKALSSWFTMALVEMIHLKDFRLDFNWISKRFSNLITAEQAKETFEILQTLGIIKIENGKAVPTNQTLIASSHDISPELIKNYHKQNIPLGMKAIDEVESHLREIIACSLALPEDRIQILKDKIQELRDEILEYTADFKDCDHVYQLNVQFFPLTKAEVK